MHEPILSWIETAGVYVEATGVAVMITGAVLATVRFAWRWCQREFAYTIFRQNLGRSILLGLEFLVAGDIIHTVAVSPTLQSVAVLGLIVLIRTFLSVMLQLEIEGHWPWQKPRACE